MSLVLPLILAWQLSFLVKVCQCFEEAEDLGLREDVRKDAEVNTELLEAFKIHLESPIGVERVERKHCLVDY